MLGQGGLLETMGAGSVIGVFLHLHARARQNAGREGARQGVEVLDAPICRGQMAADTGTMLILVRRQARGVRARQAIYSTFGQGLCAARRHRRGQFGKAMNNFLLG